MLSLVVAVGAILVGVSTVQQQQFDAQRQTCLSAVTNAFALTEELVASRVQPTAAEAGQFVADTNLAEETCIPEVVGQGAVMRQRWDDRTTATVQDVWSYAISTNPSEYASLRSAEVRALETWLDVLSVVREAAVVAGNPGLLPWEGPGLVTPPASAIPTAP